MGKCAARQRQWRWPLLHRSPRPTPPPPHGLHPPRRALAEHARMPAEQQQPPPVAPAKVTFSRVFQSCAQAGREALAAGRAAHARMVVSGFVPTAFVSNCLLQMYARCAGAACARRVFDAMPRRDTVSWNTMLTAYSHAGDISTAVALFDGMPDPDVVSWNALVSGYCQRGMFQESVDLFVEMARRGVSPDRTTFAVLLKSCSALEELSLGVQVHALAVKTGLEIDVRTGSALVDMYGKCRSLDDALCFFYGMPERNWVSWGAAIAGCVQNEQYVRGLELFIEMQRLGLGVSQPSYASAFRSCAAMSCLNTGRQLHAHAIKNKFSSDRVVGTAIVDVYAKANSLTDARRAFFGLPNHTVETCNAMMVGLVRAGLGVEAMGLFQFMIRSSIRFDVVSLSGVFSACAETKGYFQGQQVHCLAIKSGFDVDICVNNAVLDLYGKCKALMEAYLIFQGMKQKDSVSWNAIIAALEQNGHYDDTILHFNEMLRFGMKPDDFTYGSVLKACAALRSLEYGLMVHDKVIKSGLGSDAFVASTVVDMYCKCGIIDEAQKLHDRIGGQQVVSWNAILSGFSLNKESEEAQKFFSEMLDMGLKPDHFTFATVLDTCANLATIELGKQIHGQIIKQEMLDDEYISSTLVDMYAKCGDMPDSLLVFEKAEKRDFVSWNAMICGYALHGLGVEALRMFERMQKENVVPNHATFVAVLRACSHVGLFDDGCRYFHLMTTHYKLEPQLEHFACMVDILGRSKGPREAVKFINSMPFQADAVIWKTLLSICKIRQDVEIAELAASNVLLLDPDDSSVYILLSNVYAESGKWADVSRTRRLLKQGRLKKEPGCSWIEVQSEMHGFLVGDKAHPRSGELYEMLNDLIGEMKLSGCEPDSASFVEVDEEGSAPEHDDLLGVVGG
ncbi:pentatricopeptide repeat-containing protein At3g02330, mitochondrial [Oryza glaberrima]|uniref:Pentatricopeptide repeat-containing protein n=1 Tax=Oryza glaberrima TaxID=4538 RepID=I1QVW1_ORYGL|nr:pentatricopeptide repeat-containing protein At3g02330, mitochondrial [Oryza glaberrima]XP_052133861.1 pentatricopeptide repeat-containing protein At3g02330, mitochondrial [Oryza glaberrima]XP_052133862.1 pentatricopeptide repeat-containing protein At3g02330, mitochondrial [Oryza glaberrima]XP_052133863.1 pentatricopeptide repeat-containing protein At3g02330, mitochondrial [Oryza glaberrima]